jgi:hypothetical protein
MRLEAYADIPIVQWDAACDASDEAWFFHRHEWVAIEAAAWAELNASFAIVDGRGVLGVAPLYALVSGAERLVHSGLHRHAGLALRDDLSPGERRAARDAYMKQVFRVAGAFGAHRVQLSVHNLSPAMRGPLREEIPFFVKNFGFHSGLAFGPMGIQAAPGMSTCNADQIVDLNLAEETLFANLDEACRRAVRKAQKSGLNVREGTQEEDICAYYALAKLSARRTGESLPPLDYYERIWQTFRARGHCRLLFAEGIAKPLAALMLFADRGAMNFAAGVAAPEAMPLRANDFVHWEAIRMAKREGFSHYRLGPIFPEVPSSWPIARVSRFKGKFGGRSVPMVQGSFFLDPARYLQQGIDLVTALCAPRPEEVGVDA